ncbi:MAG: hypothetical protein ACRCZF_25750, partial [Gemmataceae bacterium]
MTFRSPGGADDVSLAQTAKLEYTVSGSVGGTAKLANGVPYVQLLAADVKTFGIDVGANDADTTKNRVVVDLSSGKPLPSGGMRVLGGVGVDKLLITANADIALSPTKVSITGLGDIAISSIDKAELTGGAAANNYNISSWNAGVVINGDKTDTVLIAGDNNYTLTGTQITGTNGLDATLNGLTKVTVRGGPGDNKFTPNNSKLTATLDGLEGADTYVLDPLSTGVTIAESGTDKAQDVLLAVGTAKNDLIAISSSSLVINGKTFILAATAAIEVIGVDGLAGDDTFTYDISSGLAGGTLPRFSGGTGENTFGLIGTPAQTVAQGSVRFTGLGAGTIVLDADGSGGPNGQNPGADALAITFTEFSNIASIVPAARFDVPFSPDNDSIIVNDGELVAGSATMAVVIGENRLLLAGSDRVVLNAGFGSDSVVMNLTTTVPGL